MRIDNLLSLIKGELKNSPSIQKIDGISSNAEKIARGDLFLALYKEDIPKAIAKGAYAIVYEGSTPIIDKEIAWIEVKSIDEVAKRIFRFLLIKNNTSIIALDTISLEIAKVIIYDKRALFINGWIDGLENFSSQKYIFLSKEYASKLSLEPIEPKRASFLKLYQKYLFETSFIFDGIFFERIHLSPFFWENLQKIFWLIEKFNLSFQLENFDNFSHFKPNFINSAFKITEFGKSSRAIITEPSLFLLTKERNYLIAQAPWAKTLFLSQKPLDGFQTFKDLNKLKDILYNSSFTFALVHTDNQEWSFLVQKSEPKTLF